METFLSLVAHDLKTPRAILIGNVQLLARRLASLLVRPDGSQEDVAREGGLLRVQAAVSA